MNDRIELVGPWNTLWGGITSSLGGGKNFIGVVAVLGVILIVAGLITFLWQKRRGSGGNTKQLVMTTVIGALLAGPSVVIPLILTIAELLVNIVLGVANKVV